MLDCTKYKTWVTIGHLHIPDLILKLYVFDISFHMSYCPCVRANDSKNNFIIIFLKTIYIYLNAIKIKG